MFRVELAREVRRKTSYVLLSGLRSSYINLITQSLLITIVELKSVSNFTCLSAILDEHLTWNDHIFMVKNKVSNVVGSINARI